MSDTLEMLARRSDVETFEPGEPIYREREPGSIVFLLVEGEVVVESEGRPDETVRPGELFGEAAFLGEDRRHDSARAVTAARVVPIGPALYSSLAAKDSSFAWMVRSSRSRRLKRIAVLTALGSILVASLLSAQVWEVGNHVVPPTYWTPGMEFGAVLATGDFNGDGVSDLAIGSPSFDSYPSDNGVVEIHFGGAAGLSSSSNFALQGSAAGQRCGAALAAGDFNDNGKDELVIGFAGFSLDTPPVAHAGFVAVWEYGANGFWTLTSSWTQDSPGILGVAEADDQFGSALAVGDFDDDGYEDLAIGSSSEDVAAIEDAGAVNVVYGGPGGLTATGNQLWYRGGGIAYDAGTLDGLGYALAAGDFDGNGIDDLAIGIPGDLVDDGAIQDGSVVVLSGSFGGGLVSGGQQRFDRDILGVLPPGTVNSQFGATLAAGDLDRNLNCMQAGICADDLVIGARNANVDGVLSAGIVYALFGDSEWGGLDTESVVPISQSLTGATIEQGERFGEALAVGPLSGRPGSDLVVGTPGESGFETPNAGCAQVARNLDPEYDATFNPDSQYLWAMPGYESAPMDEDMEFGSALAIGDFNGDGSGDLAVGLPGFLVDGEGRVGGVQILYGALFADGFESGWMTRWSNF